jgi:hypothetical protein
MKETDFKTSFVNHLKKTLCRLNLDYDIKKIESPIVRGIADINFNIDSVPGWIETKYLKEWPKRQTTRVKFHRYTEQQYNFLMHRGKLGEKTFLIARIENDIVISQYPYIWRPDVKYTKENIENTFFEIYPIYKFDYEKFIININTE